MTDYSKYFLTKKQYKEKNKDAYIDKNFLFPAEYNKKYFYYDNIKCGNIKLNSDDIISLIQDINIKCLKLINAEKYLKANSIETYCRKAYKNAIIDFLDIYIEDSKMSYTDFKNTNNIEKILGSLDECISHIPYWDFKLMQGLTDIEQDILTLKHVGQYTNEEIIRLIRYEGSEAGIRQICCRIKKKLLETYPHFQNKNTGHLDKYSNIVDK